MNSFNLKHGFSEDKPKQKNTIRTDSVDRDLFLVSQSLSPGLLERKSRFVKKDYPQIQQLQEDVYAALFKNVPQAHDQHEMDAKYLLNRHVLLEGVGSTQYKKLRAMTKLDDVTSLVATESLMRELEPLLDQQIEEEKKRQEALEKLRQELEKLMQDGDGEGSGLGQGEDGQGGQPGQAIGQGDADGEGDQPGKAGNKKNPKRRTIQEVKKLIEAEHAKAKQPLDRTARRQVRKAFGEAQAATKAHVDFIESWGLGTDRSFALKSHKEKMAIVNKLKTNKKLKRMAELIGKLRPLAQRMQKEKVKKIPSRIQDITFGSNPHRALPQDLMMLRHPILKRKFFKDVAEGSLREYEYGGNRKKGKGPIICCIDSSGSMDGENEIWAKALAMGILDIAKAQRRDAIFIQFEGSTNVEDLLVDRFDKNDPWSIEKVIAFAESFLGGGTDFQTPLKHSRTLIDDHPDFTKADIVFITDGHCAVSDKFLKKFIDWRDKKNVTIQGILIDVGSHNSTTVEEFAQTVKFLENLNIGNEQAVKAASSIFDKLI